MLCTAYSTPISHDRIILLLQLLWARESLLNLWEQTRGCSKMMMCCLQFCGCGACQGNTVRTIMSRCRRQDRLQRFPPRDAIETTQHVFRCCWCSSPRLLHVSPRDGRVSARLPPHVEASACVSTWYIRARQTGWRRILN